MPFFSILLLALTLFLQPLHSAEQPAPEDIAITVLVHGIISVKPYMSVDNFIRFKQDKISNSSYAYAIELTRKDPFYHQHHAMQELGLQPVDVNTIAPGLGATAFARAYDAIAHKSGYGCTNNLYYTFGWSGLLSKKMRIMEAEIFYKALLDIVQPYYDKKIYPKLRVIGYSHGGRLALELAAAHGAWQGPKLKVDELILVGMPVVSSCATLVASSLFKKVYHIYSEKDRVQRIDFASVTGLFSNRTFRSVSCTRLSKKLTQINFRIFRLTRGYEEVWNTTQPCFFNSYRRLRPAHPGHSELWSFGWTPKGYRQTLPYNPLPAAVFVPYLIQAAQKFPDERHVVVELHPYCPAIYASPKGTCACLQLPLLSPQELRALTQDALLFKPANFTYEEFQAHSQAARDAARKLHSKHNPYF